MGSTARSPWRRRRSVWKRGALDRAARRSCSSGVHRAERRCGRRILHADVTPAWILRRVPGQRSLCGCLRGRRGIGRPERAPAPRRRGRCRRRGRSRRVPRDAHGGHRWRPRRRDHRQACERRRRRPRRVPRHRRPRRARHGRHRAHARRVPRAPRSRRRDDRERRVPGGRATLRGQRARGRGRAALGEGRGGGPRRTRAGRCSASPEDTARSSWSSRASRTRRSSCGRGRSFAPRSRPARTVARARSSSSPGSNTPRSSAPPRRGPPSAPSCVSRSGGPFLAAAGTAAQAGPGRTRPTESATTGLATGADAAAAS
jgi:hypothetical protein